MSDYDAFKRNLIEFITQLATEDSVKGADMVTLQAFLTRTVDKLDLFEEQVRVLRQNYDSLRSTGIDHQGKQCFTSRFEPPAGFICLPEDPKFPPVWGVYSSHRGAWLWEPHGQPDWIPHEILASRYDNLEVAQRLAISHGGEPIELMSLEHARYIQFLTFARSWNPDAKS